MFKNKACLYPTLHFSFVCCFSNWNTSAFSTSSAPAKVVACLAKATVAFLGWHVAAAPGGHQTQPFKSLDNRGSICLARWVEMSLGTMLSIYEWLSQLFFVSQMSKWLHEVVLLSFVFWLVCSIYCVLRLKVLQCNMKYTSQHSENNYSSIFQSLAIIRNLGHTRLSYIIIFVLW